MSLSLPLTQADREFLAALRADLHRHPELSWQEVRTQERLERALRESGVTDVRRAARTGLVARVPGTGGGRTVAIRGDMDALPITERTGLPFASANPGVMHACGHDVHSTWAVGAARLLARSPAAGDVVVLLQPAEEVGEGALQLIADGALDGVTMAFAGHVDRRFALGTVVAQPGPLAASTDTFKIVLQGRAAHGARPHLGVDPVVGAAAVVTALQTIVSRRLDPAEPGVVTVGAIHGGTAPNAIPETVELAGTIRATTPAARSLLQAEVERLAREVGAAHGLQVSASVHAGTPPVVNSPAAADAAARAVIDTLGPNAVVPLGFTNMGGEDFAYYAERVPACFMRIGAREAGGEVMDIHTPQFVPAEEAIYAGSAVLAQCARVAAATAS